MHLVITLSEFEYNCGSPVVEPDHFLKNKVFVRPGLSCATPVEIPYYSSDIGCKDLCAVCAAPDAQIDAELKKKFKTVLPQCMECNEKGFKVITQRPYGHF